jgi:AcrR family transcriptional regulator
VFSERNDQTGLMSAPRTARERIRDEVTREILTVARAHLAHEGAAALSLRSIARELEMAPSALYRYFASRDVLLSALILEAYEALADAATAASETAYADGGGALALWVAVPRAMRTWALGHPHEWGLIFGSPVPGYHAPQETIVPYVRLARALVRPIIGAHEDGSLLPVTMSSTDGSALAAAVQPVHDDLLPGLPTPSVSRALQAFGTLIGVISLELFGHWNNTVLAPGVFFEETIAVLASTVGVCPPGTAAPGRPDAAG